MYKKRLGGSISNVSDKVNLITLEYILLNAVMFEPVVDMAMNHLMELLLMACLKDESSLSKGS